MYKSAIWRAMSMVQAMQVALKNVPENGRIISHSSCCDNSDPKLPWFTVSIIYEVSE